MPKLWRETIEEHRREVRDAILDATLTLVAEHGLASVTMSQVAEATGIGRATLYKYFPDVEAILVAWHERQVDHHLAQLAAVRDAAGTARDRLEAVLQAYALIVHESRRHHGSDLGQLAARLHRATHHERHEHHEQHERHHGEHVARTRDHLRSFLADLLGEAAVSGDVRADVAPAELAAFCLHALDAAGSLPSQAAVRRLVAVTLSGLRPVS